jgi:hypothetical protein
MLSNMPPTTWAITTWLDQLWIGMTMGFVLSAALATPVADNRMADAPTAKIVFLSFISVSSVLLLFIDI